MTFQELPIEVQERLSAERKELRDKWHRNDAYAICLVSEDGRRYFTAFRHAVPTKWMPFGGGSEWSIYYGAIQFARTRNPLGEISFEWVKGKRYTRSSNGTDIPNTLKTKKDVVELIKKIGKF